MFSQIFRSLAHVVIHGHLDAVPEDLQLFTPDVIYWFTNAVNALPPWIGEQETVPGVEAVTVAAGECCWYDRAAGHFGKLDDAILDFVSRASGAVWCKDEIHPLLAKLNHGPECRSPATAG